MKQMKINSEIEYKRDRVINGHGPHKILKMIQQKMLAKKAPKTEVEK